MSDGRSTGKTIEVKKIYTSMGKTRMTLVDVSRHSEVIPFHNSLSSGTKLYKNTTFKINDLKNKSNTIMKISKKNY